MKQIIIKTLLGIMVETCRRNDNAQAKAYEKDADAKNVTYVYISKYMLSMAGKNATPSVPGVDIKTLAGKLTGIQIINAENKAAQAKLKNDVKGIISRDKYELLMQMNEDDSRVNIYHYIAKQQSAVVMQIEDKEELTLMVFSGKFTLDDVMKMAQ